MARIETLTAPRVGKLAEETGHRAAGSPDWALIAAVMTLTLVGLIFVFSSSFAVGEQLFGDPRFFAKRQLLGAGIGAVAFVFFALLDYRRLRAWSPLIMAGAVLLLLAVITPGVGHSQNGAQRWIQFGSAPPIQPSEIAKLAIVIYIAAWLSSRGDAIRHVTLGVLPFSVIVGFIGFLIMAEPDLGTAVTITLIAGGLFFIAGAALKHIVVLILGGGTVLFGIIGVFGYGLDRFTQFVSAESDPEAGGFQILQLLIALGSGGLTGVGIGESRQKFFYVPSAHTDGVFAIIGEEVGFLGAILIIFLFAFLIHRGIRIASKAPDQFGTLLAMGVVIWFATQAFFNIGGVTRTIPLTGIPLPLISFGSSALVATLAAGGVLVSVSRYSIEREEYREQEPRRRLRDYVVRPFSQDAPPTADEPEMQAQSTIQASGPEGAV